MTGNNACFRAALYEKIADSGKKLIKKIGALRDELEKESAILPIIRIKDLKLTQNQAVIFWDGKEAWRKDFKETDAILCADEIIAQLRLNCLKK